MSAPFPVSCDEILGGRLRLIQPREGYRVAIDPILLAAAVPAVAGERVLDLGCGIGTAALCVARRVASVTVTGIDIQGDLVALAQANAAGNGLADRAVFRTGDVLTFADGRYDHVCANPPYLERDRASLSPNPIKAIANVEGAAKLADWVRAAIACVAVGGSVTFIHRAERAAELAGLMAAGLGSLRLLPLLPKAGAAPKRALVQGVKGGRGAATHLPAFPLHAGEGGYSAAAEAVLRNARPLLLSPGTPSSGPLAP